MNKGNLTGFIAILVMSIFIITFSGPIYYMINADKFAKEETIKDSTKDKAQADENLIDLSDTTITPLEDNFDIEENSVKTAIGTYNIQNFLPTDKENYYGIQQYICYLRANAEDEIIDCIFDYIPMNTAIDHNGLIQNGNATLISFKSDRESETFDGHISDGSEIDLINLAKAIKLQKSKSRIDDYFVRTNAATSPLAMAFYDAYEKLAYKGASEEDFFSISTYAELTMDEKSDVGSIDASNEKNGRIIYNIYNCVTHIDRNKMFTSVELTESRAGTEINSKGKNVKDIKHKIEQESDLVPLKNLCVYAKGRTISDFLTTVTHECDDLGNPKEDSELIKVVNINIMNYAYMIGQAYYNTEKLDKNNY